MDSMTNSAPNTPDWGCLHRRPYRGIATELARELGLTKARISQRVREGDPEVIAALIAKMDAREARENERAAALAQFHARLARVAA